MVELFDWLVQPCLDFIDTECRFVIQTSPIHLVQSLMKLYTCLMGESLHCTDGKQSVNEILIVLFLRFFLDEIAASGTTGAQNLTSQQITMWLQGLFLFVVVWSLGGTITGDSRKKFDVFFRDLITGKMEEHPQPKVTTLKKDVHFPEKGQLSVTSHVSRQEPFNLT